MLSNFITSFRGTVGDQKTTYTQHAALFILSCHAVFLWFFRSAFSMFLSA